MYKTDVVLFCDKADTDLCSGSECKPEDDFCTGTNGTNGTAEPDFGADEDDTTDSDFGDKKYDTVDADSDKADIDFSCSNFEDLFDKTDFLWTVDWVEIDDDDCVEAVDKVVFLDTFDSGRSEKEEKALETDGSWSSCKDDALDFFDDKDLSVLARDLTDSVWTRVDLVEDFDNGAFLGAK